MSKRPSWTKLLEILRLSVKVSHLLYNTSGRKLYTNLCHVLFPDGAVPEVVKADNKPSECCYRNITDPYPGGYVSFNSVKSEPFCTGTELNDDGGRWPPHVGNNSHHHQPIEVTPSAKSYSYDPLPIVEHHQHSSHHTCDLLIPPRSRRNDSEFEFNITSSSRSKLWKQWSLEGPSFVDVEEDEIHGHTEDDEAGVLDSVTDFIVDVIDWLGSTSEELEEASKANIKLESSGSSTSGASVGLTKRHGSPGWLMRHDLLLAVVTIFAALCWPELVLSSTISKVCQWQTR